MRSRCGKCNGQGILLLPSSLLWAIGGSLPSAFWVGCFPVPRSFGGNPPGPIPSAFLAFSGICHDTYRSACGRALSFVCASASAIGHPAHCSLRRLPGSAGGRGTSNPSPTACPVGLRGMEYGAHAWQAAYVLWLFTQPAYRLPGRAEYQIIHLPGVAPRQAVQTVRQCKSDMAVGNLQHAAAKRSTERSTELTPKS